MQIRANICDFCWIHEYINTPSYIVYSDALSRNLFDESIFVLCFKLCLDGKVKCLMRDSCFFFSETGINWMRATISRGPRKGSTTGQIETSIHHEGRIFKRVKSSTRIHTCFDWWICTEKSCSARIAVAWWDGHVYYAINGILQHADSCIDAKVMRPTASPELCKYSEDPCSYRRILFLKESFLDPKPETRSRADRMFLVKIVEMEKMLALEQSEYEIIRNIKILNLTQFQLRATSDENNNIENLNFCSIRGATYFNNYF